MTDEEQMIQDVLAGKTDSFRRIIERYQKPLFQMTSNLVFDRHAAEDITQEVFLSAYQKLSAFDPSRSRFSTWLFTIARNKSINYLRKNKQTVAVEQVEIECGTHPGDAMDSRAFFRALDDALNRLQPSQKRAFMLAEFENLPYDRIAQIECVSIGTVKSRIHRAKQTLRKALAALNGEQR